MTRSLAAEFAPKTRVNAIAPSLTETPLAGKLLSTPEKVETQAKLNPVKSWKGKGYCRNGSLLTVYGVFMDNRTDLARGRRIFLNLIKTEK